MAAADPGSVSDADRSSPVHGGSLHPSTARFYSDGRLNRFLLQS
jgi:hypothetical protein